MVGWLADLLAHFRDMDIEGRPVYFVSSNDHSLANLLSGFAAKNRKEILARLLEDERLKEVGASQRRRSGPRREPPLLLDAGLRPVRREPLCGPQVRRGGGRDPNDTISPRFVDLKAQIIEIAKLKPDRMDCRLAIEGATSLEDSRSLILNVDYPLGLAAHHLLTQAMERLRTLSGVYVMGKAATIYGRLGDVMIPKVVFDMHSRRLFHF